MLTAVLSAIRGFIMILRRFNRGFNPFVKTYQVVVYHDKEWKPYYRSINYMDALMMANTFKSNHPEIPVKVITRWKQFILPNLREPSSPRPKYSWPTNSELWSPMVLTRMTLSSAWQVLLTVKSSLNRKLSASGMLCILSPSTTRMQTTILPEWTSITSCCSRLLTIGTIPTSSKTMLIDFLKKVR